MCTSKTHEAVLTTPCTARSRADIHTVIQHTYMATNPHGHVINRSSMSRFEESSARHTFQSNQPLDKLIKAASQPTGDDGADEQLYPSIVNRPGSILNPSSSLLEYNRTGLSTNTIEPLPSKHSRSHYESTQDLHPPVYSQAGPQIPQVGTQAVTQNVTQAGPERSIQSSNVSGSSLSQIHTFPPLHSTPNAHRPIPTLSSHGILTPDSNPPPNILKKSPTIKDRNFRYMYLTDNQLSGSNAVTSKYTGRLVTQESISKGHQPESSNSRDAESLPTEKIYACTHKGCAWSFSRPSDLRRHAKSHRAPAFHCPYYAKDSSCHRNGGSFARSDVLKRHLRLMHYVRDRQMLYPGPDPGWCRSCQKMFESTKAFLDHCSECATQSKPAVWKVLTTNDDSDQ